MASQALPANRESGEDLLGAFEVEFGRVSLAGRPRFPSRLLVSVLCLKNSFDLSDKEFVERWAENVQWVRRRNRQGAGGASPLQ